MRKTSTFMMTAGRLGENSRCGQKSWMALSTASGLSEPSQNPAFGLPVHRHHGRGGASGSSEPRFVGHWPFAIRRSPFDGRLAVTVLWTACGPMPLPGSGARSTLNPITLSSRSEVLTRHLFFASM